MRDKFKVIWAQMRASMWGPEPLVIKLHDGEVIVQTMTLNEPNSGCSEGMFVAGNGKTLDAALDDFSKNLDTWLADVEGDE